MKTTPYFMLSIFLLSLTFYPVGYCQQLEPLMNTLLEKYDGKIIKANKGEVHVIKEKTKDTQIKVIFKDLLAGNAFYNMPDAKMVKSGNQNGMQFIDRKSDSLYCRLYSSNLLRDPTPAYTCALQVSKKGTISAFDFTKEGDPSSKSTEQHAIDSVSKGYLSSGNRLRSDIQKSLNFSFNFWFEGEASDHISQHINQVKVKTWTSDAGSKIIGKKSPALECLFQGTENSICTINFNFSGTAIKL